MAEGTSKKVGSSSFGSAATVSCPQHPNAHLVEDYHAGDMVCPECGLVVGDRYVYGRLCIAHTLTHNIICIVVT